MTITSALTTGKNTSQIDSPFVTIILPLDYESDKTPYHVLEELIGEVKDQLQVVSESAAFKVITKKLNRLIVKLPPQNIYKGVVAFLSEEVEDIIPVNYEVNKKVTIAENFDFEEVQQLSSKVGGNEQENKSEASSKDEVTERLGEFRLFGKRTY